VDFEYPGFLALIDLRCCFDVGRSAKKDDGWTSLGVYINYELLCINRYRRKLIIDLIFYFVITDAFVSVFIFSEINKGNQIICNKVMSKIISFEEFSARVEKVTNSRISVVKETFTGMRNKVIAYCNVHKIYFEVYRAYDLTKLKIDCPECSEERKRKRDEA
jgi:hypothetical protein